MTPATWDPCARGCPGWIVEADRDVVQACDECRRFTADGRPDDDAARAHVIALARGRAKGSTRETRRARAWLRRHPAPRLACPHCGNTALDGDTPLVWQEWLPSTRRIACVERDAIDVTDAVIVVDADSYNDASDGEDDEIYCRRCHGASPIPDGFTIDHDSGRELAAREAAAE